MRIRRARVGSPVASISGEKAGGTIRTESGRGRGLTTNIGGSLGWKTRGALDAAFEKAAYELDPSTTGSPKWVEVKTGHGYHVIMVEGRR